MRDVQWIFFDLGSTLIDETAADLRRVRDMTAGTGITAEQYLAKRRELAAGEPNADAAALAFFGLTKTPWHSELETPCPDAAPTLEALRKLGYRLGVIANQQPGARERLAAWGLLGFFDLVASSAELGLSKPDPAIFRWALEQAGCAPEAAVMVGDRINNDIAPAKRLGMRTVRILRGPASRSVPHCRQERADWTVSELTELTELFDGRNTMTFYDTTDLISEEIALRLDHTFPGDPVRGWVPAYYFDILDREGQKVGNCDLRIGHTEGLYYGGNIGYAVEEPYRGHHYAEKACRLLFRLAQRHGLGYLIITCQPSNLPSRRTCERLGGQLLEIVELPEDNDMRVRDGHTRECVYRFELTSTN